MLPANCAAEVWQFDHVVPKELSMDVCYQDAAIDCSIQGFSMCTSALF